MSITATLRRMVPSFESLWRSMKATIEKLADSDAE